MALVAVSGRLEPEPSPPVIIATLARRDLLLMAIAEGIPVVIPGNRR